VSDFKERLAESRRKLQAEGKLHSAIPAVPSIASDPDLIPDIETRPRTEEDDEIDNIIDGIDILQAYQKWCGKMTPNAKGKTESIMISCPKPEHPDKVPSAWINTEKQTWFCGGCQEGGDKYDIAAMALHVPDYKHGKAFHDLRRAMAESLGYTIKKLPGNVTVLTPPVEEDSATPAAGQDGASTGDDTASVTALPDLELDPDEIEWPTLDWRSVVTPHTFLDVWMQQTIIDDVPEEYHFWNGMLALGMACGRQTTLYDSRPVYANLFLCTLGHSGSGKSKAKGHLDKLLDQAFPYDRTEDFPMGVLRASSPASAEALIWVFQKPVMDPNNPKVVMAYAPIKGIIDFSELAGLTGRAARQGNTIVPTMMQFYDVDDKVATVSRMRGEEVAELPFASCITTTQPRSLKRILSSADVDSGFLNRWVFVTGGLKRRVSVGGARVDVAPAVAPLQAIHGWAATPKQIMWSEPALMAFDTFFHDTILPTMQKDKSGLYTRLDLLMKKLVLLFTANEMHNEVQVQTVEKMKVLWEYVVGSYDITSGSLANTDAESCRDDILRIIQLFQEKMNRGPSMREIGQRLSKGKYDRALVVRVVDIMEKMGDIEAVKAAGVGRPTVRYTWAS
jgi:hypothetical protein